MRNTTFSAIERLIQSAAHFVQPSRDLRPRTVQAAREFCRDQRAEQKLGGFALAVLLVMLLSSPAMQYAEVLRTQSGSPTASDMERLAIEYSEKREVGTHFGLTEAFTELRHFQAGRLGHMQK